METKKNFGFIDTIRCISMMGIVFEHSIITMYHQKLSDTVLNILFFQIFKFVTIAFFIIGGFLINHKFQEYTPIQYLKNRLKNTILPWIFWIVILIAIKAIYLIYTNGKPGNHMPLPSVGNFLLEQVIHSVFFTSFWFIPNFLICISILLIFKKFLHKVWFGILLFAISSIYSINIYKQWFLPGHTTALFGFVFYLWLGVFMNRHYEKVAKFVYVTSFNRLIFINLFLFSLAVGEALYMYSLGYPEIGNTLRITNVLYSLAMFLTLLKVGKITWLTNHIQPRQTTFGIYLVHFMLTIYLTGLFFKPFHIIYENLNAYQVMGLSLMRFLLVYFASLFIVKAIIKTKFKWLVGMKSDKEPEQPENNSVNQNALEIENGPLMNQNGYHTY